MISTSDFSRGLTIVIDGQLYTIVEFSASHQGRGSAIVKAKLKNIENGVVVERAWKSGEKFEQAILENREMQYLYKSDELYTFMDTETYEQMTLSANDLGDAVDYLKENAMVNTVIYKGRAIGVDLPASVELTITETPPGVRGNTVSNATKAATLETGKVIQVPLFVNEGEVVRVDTRTGEYLTRV